MTDHRPTLIEHSDGAQHAGPAMPYTQGTHDALVAAQAVSRPSTRQAPTSPDRHESVNAAHLMLALLAETGSTATRALTDQGVRLGRARMRIAALTLPPADAPARTDGPLPAIDAVLAAARSDAARRGHAAVGTGHLLIALTAPHALADELTALGLDLPAAAGFIYGAYSAHPPAPRDTGPEFA
ncbi:Clp protease N-terminal domain-containing protein [Tomitella fengzijianii]|uniref:Clp R domain-containing protein n=1 Tax=Tomitella fengzijianii TaxID=2597660 RepID=A0A516X2S0_9ACTN|nr:Clp protease N-terminal domain-containing protein [Tomitella fengzijianii]QDQ97330.1 hypothetical protein FO059_08340 [Tomitella fengzijianii]